MLQNLHMTQVSEIGLYWDSSDESLFFFLKKLTSLQMSGSFAVSKYLWNTVGWALTPCAVFVGQWN